MSGIIAGAIGGALLVGGAVAIVAGAVIGYAIAEGIKSLVPEVDAGTQGSLTNKASSNDPIPILYGTRRIGATKVFVETGGTDNKYLHQILILGEGVIDSVTEVFVDDESLIGSKYASFVTWVVETGTTAQSATSTLVSNSDGIWTTAHKLSGIAYAYVRLTYDQDTFISGIPTINFIVKGVKVHDPRSPSAADAWSDNPALCIRDYLTNTLYGRGIPASEIDDASFVTAANYCDNNIPLGSVSKRRYTCNGIVNTESGSISTLKALVTCCRGMLIFSAGKYKLLIDKPETASFDFDDNNIIGGWNIQMGSKANRYNKVSANFTNKETNWRDDIASASSATYKTNDNGLKLETTVQLPFNTDIERAKMLCAIALNESRQQIAVTFIATIDALNVQVGDVVNITDANMGWTDKTFRVMRLDIKSSSEIKVTAREHENDVYTFGTIDAQDTINNTTLLDLSTVAMPTGVVVTENLTLPSTAMNVNWTASADAFVVRYLVQYKLTTSSTWVSHVYSAGTGAVIRDIVTGTYDVRVKAENTAGTSSAWVTPLTAFTITASPTMPNILNLAVQDNNTTVTNEFTGKDAKFVWDDFDTTSQDPLLFADYVVTLTKVDGTAVRSEAVHDNEYIYTYEKNLEDNGGFPLRQFRIAVTQRGNRGQVSTTPTSIGTAIGGATPYPNNPAPSSPSVTVNTTFNTMYMNFNAPSDTDFSGYKVWASLDSALVTTLDKDLVYKGFDNLVVINAVDSGSHDGTSRTPIDSTDIIYYKYAAYDAFGETNLNVSSQATATAGLAPTGGIQTYYSPLADVTCDAAKDGAILFDTTPADPTASPPVLAGANKPYRCNSTAWIIVNDLAISDSQIVANTITAGSIHADTITGNEIDATNISAHHVNVGTSATTGARMNISATTIKIYDTSSDTVPRIVIGDLS